MSEETLTHDPSVDENPDPAAWGIVFYGIVGTVVVILSVLALEVFYGATAGREDRRKSDGPATVKLQQQLEQQRAPIEGYAWIDEENGVVALPIERAMELMVEEAGQ